MDVENIGKFLLKLRKENSLTQKDISKLCNVSTQAVSKWERGESIPDIEILERLSIVYKLSINELIGGEKKEVYLDIDKRKNIIYLTTSILVFVAYLFNFVHGNAQMDFYMDWNVEVIMKGHELILNGTSGIFVYMTWIVFMTLVSHLIIRIYLITKVINKTEGVKRYLNVSMLIVIFISLTCIFIPVFYIFPQFIIILAMFIQLSGNINIKIIEEIKNVYKKFKENYNSSVDNESEIENESMMNKRLILVSRILIIIEAIGFLVFALTALILTIVDYIEGDRYEEFLIVAIGIIILSSIAGVVLLKLNKYIRSIYIKTILLISGFISLITPFYLALMLGIGETGGLYIFIQLVAISIPLILFVTAIKIKGYN